MSFSNQHFLEIINIIKLENNRKKRQRIKKKNIVETYTHLYIVIYILYIYIVSARMVELFDLSSLQKENDRPAGGEKGGARKGQLAGEGLGIR